MKTILAIVALAWPLGTPVLAQNTSGQQTTSPGPQTVPVPNINTGGNPTAPARLPPNATGDPLAPTFPAGGNMPAWRGGTTGGDKTAPGGQQAEDQRRKAAEDRRRAAEPAVNGSSPSAPESRVVSPSGPGEQPNPTAPQNEPPVK